MLLQAVLLNSNYITKDKLRGKWKGNGQRNNIIRLPHTSRMDLNNNTSWPSTRHKLSVEIFEEYIHDIYVPVENVQ